LFDSQLFDSRPARRGRAIALLLGGAALGAPGAAVAATASGAAGAAAQPLPDEIVIFAPQAFRDLRPERELDQQSIAGFGVSTVDDLLGELADELGEDEEPLIFVNGERVNASDVAGLPVEVLRNVQVLPRGSAVRVGGRSGQRVLSLTLTRLKRSVTMTVAPKIASEGSWSGGRGEALFTHINGATRANVSFRSRRESGLLDSDRDIIQPEPRLPYAVGGNVIAFPSPTGEIDPALSAAAGQVVTVAPIPGTASPTLADFAAGANQAETTDVGEFRNLRPRTRNHEFNGSYSTRIAPWLTSTASLRLTRNESRSRRGLPSAQFILSDDNPASPFSRDVSLVLYGVDPLISSSQRDNGEANVTFNGTLAKWTGNLNLRHAESRDISRSQRAQFGAIPIEDDVNPFTTDLSDRIAIRDDTARGRSVLNQAQLNLTGPAIELPAGEVEATIEGRVAWSSQRSRSTFNTINPRVAFRRSEQSVRGSLDIPLTSGDAGLLPQIGDLDATVEYGLMHFSDAGTLNYHSGGLTWAPRPFVRFRAAIEKTDRPPSVQLLGNPVFIAPDIRSFDPLDR
jgi:hypothetical protein